MAGSSRTSRTIPGNQNTAGSPVVKKVSVFEFVLRRVCRHKALMLLILKRLNGDDKMESDDKMASDSKTLDQNVHAMDWFKSLIPMV